MACAGCMAAAASSVLAGDAPPAPQPSPAAQPSPSPQPAAVAAPAPPPATAAIVTPPVPAQSPAPASPIPFNTQNKEIAKSIYQSMKDIQESEFDPSANMAAITKLQDTIAQTDFNAVSEINDYVKDSLTLNTMRSRDIKIQRSDAGKNDKEKGSKSGTKVDLGMFTASGGIDNEKTNSQKNENDTSTDVSISSQNDPTVLDKARHQQATSYGLMLNELKKLGFSRPVDPRNIYGRWKWRCTGDSATYEFDFRKDGTVYVKLNADNPAHWVGHGFVNKGRGEWKLDYRSLSLEMNDVNLAGFWKQHSLIFFEGKEIVSIDDEKMVIASDEDNELKRIVDNSKK